MTQALSAASAEPLLNATRTRRHLPGPAAPAPARASKAAAPALLTGAQLGRLRPCCGYAGGLPAPARVNRAVTDPVACMEVIRNGLHVIPNRLLSTVSPAFSVTASAVCGVHDFGGEAEWFTHARRLKLAFGRQLGAVGELRPAHRHHHAGMVLHVEEVTGAAGAGRATLVLVFTDAASTTSCPPDLPVWSHDGLAFEPLELQPRTVTAPGSAGRTPNSHPGRPADPAPSGPSRVPLPHQRRRIGTRPAPHCLPLLP